MKKRLLGLMAGVGLLANSFGVAAGVSPYLPLKLNPVFELEVERLVTITGYPSLKKPYHIATIVSYLNKVKMSHPQLHGRIDRYIERYKAPYNITHLKAEIRLDGSTAKTLPNTRGRSSVNSYYTEFSAFWQPSEYVIANVAGGYSNKDYGFNFGNYISVGSDYLQVDIGYREHWLSPLQDSSQMISTQAVPMLGVTLSNIKPITDFNIMYELGFGELEEVDGIVFDGNTSTGKPGFVTMHASIQPTDWWTISGNRTMQFSGGDRGKVTLSEVWQAFIDPVSSDNCGGLSDLVDCNKEFGNQQASIANRFDLSWGDNPYSIILEVAGEDTNDYSNYKLGNKAYTLGLFIPYISPTESLSITAQLIEDAWYTHHLYRKGYSNDGHKMGHWWGDEKQATDNIGANVLSIAYTKDLSQTRHLSVKYHTIQNEYSEGRTANFSYERGHYVQVDYNWQYKTNFLGLHLYAGKDVNGESFSSVAFSKMW
jgi:hypothetical protein